MTTTNANAFDGVKEYVSKGHTPNQLEFLLSEQYPKQEIKEMLDGYNTSVLDKVLNNEDYQLKFAEKISNNLKLRKHYIDALSTINNLKADNSQLTEDLKKEKEKNKKLSEANKSYEEESIVLNETIDEKDQKISKQATEISQLKREKLKGKTNHILELANQKKEFQKEKKTLSNKMEEEMSKKVKQKVIDIYKPKADELINENHNLVEQIGSLLKEIELLQKPKIESQSLNNQEIEQLKIDKHNLKQTIQVIKNKKSDLVIDRNGLQDIINGLKVELEKEKIKHIDFVNKVFTQTNLIDNNQKEKEEIIETPEEMERRIRAEFQKREDTLKATITNQSKIIDFHEKTINSQSEQIKEQNKELTNLGITSSIVNARINAKNQYTNS